MNTWIRRGAFLSLLFALFFSSCGDEKAPATEEDLIIGEDEKIQMEAKDKIRFQRAKIVLFSLPSPMETSRILKLSGAVYDNTKLNDVNSLSQYETSRAKAIALGIFIADLSYANVFGQQQDCLDYFSAIRSLSEDLSLGNVFTAELVEKVEKNINNEDSVLKYLTDSYWDANSELKDNDRESVAALVAAGAWLEGLNIACNLVDSDNPDQEIVTRIAEQRNSLKQLINYLNSFKDPRTLQEITDDLTSLQELFDQIEVKKERQETSKDDQGVHTVGSKKTYVFPEGLLKKIIEASGNIHQKYA